MIPEPIHPAIVHFPIVLVVLLPLAAAIALISIKRGAEVRAAWLPVVGIAAALVASSWVAVKTGEQEEDLVERVVAESAIHEHEEAAELFLPLTVAGLLVVSAGLMRDRPGQIMRGVAVVAALGLFVAGYRVGHSGGELVYEHGAASAYATSIPTEGMPVDHDHEPERRSP